MEKAPGPIDGGRARVRERSSAAATASSSATAATTPRSCWSPRAPSASTARVRRRPAAGGRAEGREPAHAASSAPSPSPTSAEVLRRVPRRSPSSTATSRYGARRHLRPGGQVPPSTACRTMPPLFGYIAGPGRARHHARRRSRMIAGATRGQGPGRRREDVWVGVKSMSQVKEVQRRRSRPRSSWPRATWPARAAARTLAMRMRAEGPGPEDRPVPSRPAAGRSSTGPIPYSSLDVPLLHTAFETGGLDGLGHQGRPGRCRATRRPRSWPGPATAARSTSACRRSPARPSATRTSSTSATTTKPT